MPRKRKTTPAERPFKPRPKSGNEVDRAIGARLRVFRLGKKMSQEELGKGLGVTFQQIQKYENGKNRLSGSRLVQVCKILGCASEELLGTENTGMTEAQYGAMHDKRTSNFFIALSKLNSIQRSAVIDAGMATIRAFAGAA